MSADFTPSLNTYTDLTPFRFWCQKILPIAYDDSLSYYELLCKVVDYLNKTMEDVELSIEDVEKLHDAYEDLQEYVNDYFTNLDVQEEINNKLDALVADGTIHSIFNDDVMAILTQAQAATQQAINNIPTVVSTWLGQHVTQETGYVIDNSLSTANAAADALATGVADSNIKSAIDLAFFGEIEDDDFVQGYRTQSDYYTVHNQTTRCTSAKFYHVYPGDTISISNIAAGTKSAILGAGITSATNYDSGWKTTDFTYTAVNELIVFIEAAKSDHTADILVSDVSTVFTLVDNSTRITDNENAIGELKSDLNQEINLLQEDIGKYNYFKSTNVSMIDVTGTGAFRAGCDCGELQAGSYLLYFKQKTGTTGSLVVTTVVNGVYTQSTGIETSPYMITLTEQTRVIVRGSVTTVSEWNYYDVQLVSANSLNVAEDLRSFETNVCKKIIGWIPGSYITSGGIGATVDISNPYSTSVTDYKSVIVDCVEGDIFTISGQGGGQYRLWCFIDSSNKIVDVSGVRASLNAVIISAPHNSAKLIISQYTTEYPLSDCYKGVSPYKETFYRLAENKNMPVLAQWENGDVTSSGLHNDSTNIRTYSSIGFNQGEKLVITNNSEDLWFTVYKAKQNTFSTVVNGWLEKNGRITVDDWTCTYFVRARYATSGDISPDEGANIDIMLTNNNLASIEFDNNSTSNLLKVGFSREFSYVNPFLTFQRKDIGNDGTLVDSTTKCVAELPKIGCVEVRQEINTGCFKIAKVSSGIVTYLMDEWSYYSYRYVGDASSTYYLVVANSANTSSAITAGNAAHYIGVYTFTDYGKNVDHLNKLNGKKIAFIGDSITQGRFAKFGASSPNYTAIKPFGELVAEEIGDMNFGQFGIGGASVYNVDWRSLYANCGKVSGYDVVFVCGGTNDYGENVSESNFTAAFTYVVETLLSNNTTVVVCTPIFRTSRTGDNTAGLSLLDYVNIEKTIALANNLQVVDLYTLTNDGKFYKYLPDGLHPNEMGHYIMAKHILKSFE